MRKITIAIPSHNRAPASLLAISGLLLLAACGGGGDQPAERSSAGSVQGAEGCALVVTDLGLAAFYDLADRVARGEEVDVEAMGAVAAQPVLDRWRRSFEPEQLTAARVGRAMFIALRGRDALPERLRSKPTPSDLVGSYEVAIESREFIEPFVSAFIADEVACGVFPILADWLEPAAMPDTLRIDFLVGQSDIRLFEHHAMLDAGLAWAAGREQLVRFLASTVYRDISSLEGADPDKARGPGILLETLRLVRNEAVPAIVDDIVDITFDPRHRLLARASTPPDKICEQAQRTLISLDGALSHVRSQAAPDDEDWVQLYRLFVGARSVQPTGWYMGRVIEHRFGRERLAEANRTVADFFAAYQEAALLSPAEPESPAGSVDWYLEVAPRFSADNADWLDAQLRQRFP